jgi:hypothetical protein
MDQSERELSRIESAKVPPRSHVQKLSAGFGAGSVDFDAKDERDLEARSISVTFGRRRIELVPQPSSWPADPLVRPISLYSYHQTNMCQPRNRTGQSGGRNVLTPHLSSPWHSSAP